LPASGWPPGWGGLTVFLALFLLAWVPAPKIAEPDRLLLAQTLVLQVLSLGLVTAMGLWLSLFMPHSLALIVTGGWYFAGHILIGFAKAGGAARAWLAAYLVDFNRLNLVTRYTDGIAALDLPTLSGLILYAMLFMVVFLAAANTLFHRRAL